VIPVDERISLLRAAGVGPTRSDDDLRALALAVDVCEIAAGEVLIPEDGPSRQSFVVVDGIADIHSSGVTVATVGPGSFFNALKADHRPVGATARTPMTVLVVTPSVAQRFGLASEQAPDPPFATFGLTISTNSAKVDPRQEPFEGETRDCEDGWQHGQH
jgi:CRP-like cAMP-binding protein